jgi:hypothetical protein
MDLDMTTIRYLRAGMACTEVTHKDDSGHWKGVHYHLKYRNTLYTVRSPNTCCSHPMPEVFGTSPSYTLPHTHLSQGYKKLKILTGPPIRSQPASRPNSGPPLATIKSHKNCQRASLTRSSEVPFTERFGNKKCDLGLINVRENGFERHLLGGLA